MEICSGIPIIRVNELIDCKEIIFIVMATCNDIEDYINIVVRSIINRQESKRGNNVLFAAVNCSEENGNIGYKVSELSEGEIVYCDIRK